MEYNVQIKKAKEFNRTFSITAPDKMEAFEWGEKQAQEFKIYPKAKIEVFEVKEEKEAGKS